jgi:hypothetical protein
MAKSYGDDLRRKLLQAYDRGEGTLEQLAGRFSVSVPWAWKISAQRKRSFQGKRHRFFTLFGTQPRLVAQARFATSESRKR